ncbi:MAG TPA: hypothetical protein PKW07_01830 [Syntrophorhabdaceae bacterium]|nr:hypothetical protein [Syntrophorhabdaceae bacterium]
MQKRSSVISKVLSTLNIKEKINKILLEEVPSPWDERAFIKRKKDYLEVKLRVWDDDLYLYGRIFRLFLYIYDVLSKDFLYDPSMAPDEEKEPRLKDRHNQIWSIYVDSRLERMGIENFFDRTTRRNIFVDSEKEISWEDAILIFQELWDKESYTYPEITEITYNLTVFAEKNIQANKEKIECLVNNLFKQKGVVKQIERLSSIGLRESLNELLSFTAYKCKDSHIDSNYYGIYVTYNKRLYVEMIPTEDNRIFLTIIDPFKNNTISIIVNENTDTKTIEDKIYNIYKMMAQIS